MNVLVACEESQRVCTAFRERGHRAFSCDILPPSGGHPEWAIQEDVLELIDGDCEFITVEGGVNRIYGPWDLIIAHPPCTYLTNVATKHHSLMCSSLEAINRRTERRIGAMEFFMQFMNADCEKVAIENPVGVMNTCYRKPDQIVNPYQFASGMDDSENYVTKATCLWLKGLPPLQTNDLPKPDNEALWGRNPNGKVSNWEERQRSGLNESRSTMRSKTFPGIARAMAEQWG